MTISERSAIRVPASKIMIKNPLKMDQDILLVKAKGSKMKRRSTLPYDSLQAALLTTIEQQKHRQQQVRFSMPYCPSAETKAIQRQAHHSPPTKRRRFQRRNSKTSAMMLSSMSSYTPARAPSLTGSDVSSVSTMDDDSRTNWDSMSERGMEAAQTLVDAMIEKRQPNKEDEQQQQQQQHV